MTYQILQNFCKLANIMIKTKWKKLEFLQLINKKVIYKFISKGYWIKDIIRNVNFLKLDSQKTYILIKY